MWVLHSREDRSHSWWTRARNPPCVPEDLVPIHLQTPATRETVSVKCLWSLKRFKSNKEVTQQKVCLVFFFYYELQFYPFLREVLIQNLPFHPYFTLEFWRVFCTSLFVMCNWNFQNNTLCCTTANKSIWGQTKLPYKYSFRHFKGFLQDFLAKRQFPNQQVQVISMA